MRRGLPVHASALRTLAIACVAAAPLAMGAGVAAAQIRLGGFEPGVLPRSSLPDGGWTELEDLLPELDSDDFAVRNAAFELVRDNPRITLKSVERALKRPGLSAEAKARLSAAGMPRFASAPRGAIGFSFGMMLPDRIMVGELFNAFPASRVLETGDLIVGADGFGLDGPGGRFLLQCLIVSHDPGDVMKLTVRRGAEKLDLDVPLGSFNDLPQAFLPPGRYPLAWKLRVARLTGGVGEAARAEVPAGAWAPTAQAEQRRLERVKIAQLDAEAPLGVVGGGMPRAGNDLLLGTGFERDPQLRIVQQIINQRNGQARVVNFPVNQGFMDEQDTQRPARDPNEELAELIKLQQGLERQVGERGGGGGVPVVINPRLGQQGDPRRQLEMVNRLRAAIEADMAEKAPTAQERAEP